MSSSSYQLDIPRVIFGTGTISKLSDEVELLGAKAPFLLSTAQQQDQLEGLRTALRNGIAGFFAEATMHTPSHITERAVEAVKASSADLIISIGGGSTIGLGKAISVRTGIPHLCIATSYAGSEMTPILGETADGRKVTRSSPKILPDVVLYDVDLTRTLPATMRATSGINAIAHAVEALYAQNKSPLLVTIALEGIYALAHSLPEIVQESSPSQLQESALYGAWLCGVCLGNAGMSIHHKVCHVLGGSFNLPHGETHTAVLPHSLSYVALQVPAVMEKLATALPGSDGDALAGLNSLLSKLPVKLGLKDFGLKEEDIDRAADLAMSQPYWTPRPLERTAIRELIRRAWAGEPGRSDF
ncbi:hypothetical protein EDB81DRAFT_756465 [Dactylonectria macrodidyma]|uniref:Maleylacetate reductase n=1 Tax=Dactylonectria macrodidyma TaxID=307937 RepID=A0A9P9F8Q8_9HYPO|nr:hypothetical protein EDB81DRAFT_756465 [Dactylonectria macrodidyma]